MEYRSITTADLTDDQVRVIFTPRVSLTEMLRQVSAVIATLIVTTIGPQRVLQLRLPLILSLKFAEMARSVADDDKEDLSDFGDCELASHNYLTQGYAFSESHFR